MIDNANDENIVIADQNETALKNSKAPLKTTGFLEVPPIRQPCYARRLIRTMSFSSGDRPATHARFGFPSRRLFLLIPCPSSFSQKLKFWESPLLFVLCYFFSVIIRQSQPEYVVMITLLKTIKFNRSINPRARPAGYNFFLLYPSSAYGTF
jgi:hypothetical protein